MQLNAETGKLVTTGRFDHPYPTTKIMWVPDKVGRFPDLLATTGDYLRVWNVQNDGSVKLKCLLNNVGCFVVHTVLVLH